MWVSGNAGVPTGKPGQKCVAVGKMWTLNCGKMGILQGAYFAVSCQIQLNGYTVVTNRINKPKDCYAMR